MVNHTISDINNKIVEKLKEWANILDKYLIYFEFSKLLALS